MFRKFVVLNLILLSVVVLLAPQAWSQPVCVTAARAILRKGPGTQFPVSWTVGANMPLLKVDQKGSWTQVQDLDGEKHWIANQSISSRAACVVVRSKQAPLRAGPGAEHPFAELSFADRYTPFKKVDRDGAWIMVQDEYRSTFWIYETNVWIPVMKSKISF